MGKSGVKRKVSETRHKGQGTRHKEGPRFKEDPRHKAQESKSDNHFLAPSGQNVGRHKKSTLRNKVLEDLMHIQVYSIEIFFEVLKSSPITCIR